MSGPLQGFRVVELASERGAYAGKLLGDLGADVILVEPPGGDPTRGHAPFQNDVPGPERSLVWWHTQTSKRGVVVDLARAEGRALLRRLVLGADVFLEAEAPGRMAALGLDYASLAREKPALVMCSITPFGQAGPRRDELATDLTLLATGGPVWSCGYDDHSLPPVRGLGNQAWQIGGHYAVMSILTALLYRGVSGEGQSIDVSLYAAANVTTEMASYNWLVQRTTVQRQTGRHALETPSLPSQMQCADGRYVNTGVPPRTPGEFARLAAWLESLGITEAEFPELVFVRMGGERPSIDLSQIGRDDETTAIFAAGREALNLIAQKVSAYDFFLGAQRAGLPVGVIYAPEEAYEDPHFRARGMQVAVEHPEQGRSFRYPGAPIGFEKSPWRIARRAPRLGEHTDEVLGELGVPAGERAALHAAGVVA
jgi:crotonobetainyl-CoA:carnitine CoA-transferase CaiB-like acyl-CoA transferase